jgi:O-antigen/teichoic acid export membrane protein
MADVHEGEALADIPPSPETVATAGAAEVPAPGAAAESVRRRSSLFLIGSLAGGNLISMVLRLVSGFFLGRLVLPATLGLFTGIGLVLGYAPFLQLGILNGLNRELPYYVGKGDRQRVNELAAAAQAWAILVGGLVGTALVGVAVWQFASGETLKAVGWLTYAVLALALFYGTDYLQMTFRTSQDFAKLALANVVESASGVALLAAVAYMGFYGLCVRAVAMAAISTSLLFLWRPIRGRPRWNLRHLKHLLFVGAPIFGVGQLYGAWRVIDSTLVLKLAGTTGMGLYAMVLMASAALEVVPSAVGQVVYPRMAEEYGRTESLNGLVRIARKPMMVSAIGLIPVVMAGWLLVGPFMRALLPNYVGAVPAMQWSLLLPLVASLQPVTNLFNVARRQVLYATAIVGGVASYAGSLLWLSHGGVSLVDFPQAMLIGRLVMVALCYLFIWRLLVKDRARPLKSNE